MASLYHTYKRIRSLQTHRITAMPIVLLMPHSACNCRCVMCDIWKGNQQLKQLTERDVEKLTASLRQLGTKHVVFSGGEAILHENFFKFCEILKKSALRITLLSTGLTLKKNTGPLLKWVNEIIVSLDGDEATHDQIRNIPGAYRKMSEGIQSIKTIAPAFPISFRTVIHRLNFRKWPAIIESAKTLGVDSISFLPADVSSHAFNRELLWTDQKQHEILLDEKELDALEEVIEFIIENYSGLIRNGFIAESADKLRKIHSYYAAFYGRNDFPWKKCNAPWVSAVVEADGTVRPCFFHEAYGKLNGNDLSEIINLESAIQFRRSLDVENNETCRKCVCYLNLSPLK